MKSSHKQLHQPIDPHNFSKQQTEKVITITHQPPPTLSRRQRRTMKLLLIVTGACLISTAHAFASLPGNPMRKLTNNPISSTTTSSLSFSITPFDEVLFDSELIQAEFCNGMTHALLDFTTLWGGAATRVRLAAVIGRLFVLGQDLHHDVLPDELAFQLGLLAVACHGLASTIIPKWKAHFLTPAFMTFQDRQAFRSLFRPAGVSWINFKELHSGAMDWVTVEPGHVILNENETDGEDAVYWLYQGDVQVWSQDTFSHNISGRPEVAGLGLFGENRLAKLLDSRSSKKITKKSVTLKTVAGENGATLLRMNTTKLEKLLRHDQDLTHAVHRLAFMGMQDKLDALLLKEATSTP